MIWSGLKQWCNRVIWHENLFSAAYPRSGFNAPVLTNQMPEFTMGEGVLLLEDLTEALSAEVNQLLLHIYL